MDRRSMESTLVGLMSREAARSSRLFVSGGEEATLATAILPELRELQPRNAPG